MVGRRTRDREAALGHVEAIHVAFRIAAGDAFDKGLQKAGPVLLEPVIEVSVTTPDEYVGDIMGDLNTRRARVLGMDQEGTKSVVKAEVPLGEMQRYAADLRSMTQGRGIFSMQFLRYGRVPGHIQDDLVAQLRKQEKENDS